MPESQQVDPTKGSVAFGAALFGWAFTLKQFARFYAKKYKLTEEMMMEKLWGDNFYDRENKKWTTEEVSASGK